MTTFDIERQSPTTEDGVKKHRLLMVLRRLFSNDEPMADPQEVSFEESVDVIAQAGRVLSQCRTIEGDILSSEVSLGTGVIERLTFVETPSGFSFLVQHPVNGDSTRLVRLSFNNGGSFTKAEESSRLIGETNLQLCELTSHEAKPEITQLAALFNREDGREVIDRLFSELNVMRYYVPSDYLGFIS